MAKNIRYKGSKQPGAGNETTNAVQQPKGRAFSWVTNNITYTSVSRGAKDILSLKEALQLAETVYQPNRYLLYDLYKDVELDGFLTGIINKLIDTILNKTILYKVNDKPVKEMDTLIKSLLFRKMCRELLMKEYWGITGLEFIPGDQFRFNVINRKHIKPKWRKITNDQYTTEGVSYDECWNLWVIGEEGELGLYLICAYYVLLKKGVISNWAEFIEMYGLPTTVMKYETYDEVTKAELKRIIKNAGTALQLVIPKSAEHEIHDAKNTANGDVQNKFRMMANEEMAVLINGATETSTSSSQSGGRSQAEEHGKQQKEKVKALMDYLVNCLNDPIFINILRNYGFPVVDGGAFCFDKEVDIEYLKAKKEIDIAIIGAGLPVSEEYLYRTYAIDRPAANETLLVRPGAAASPADGNTPQPPAVQPQKQPKEQPANKPPKQKPASVQKKNLRSILRDVYDFFAPAR